MSNFLRDISEYKREIDVVDGYFEQTSLLMQKMTGKSKDITDAWLKREFAKGGRFEFKPPVVDITIRDKETGDRRPSQTDMNRLLNFIDKNNLIISPSMTIYLPPEQRQSLLAVFTDENISARGKIKKEMFAAKAAGNLVLAANKENEQNAKKTRNNALSGAHSSASTILYNKSTHSSLTSTCRSATSYGNANNEKVLAGSRHYWAPGIVINNILAICSLTDFEAFSGCFYYYQMYMPTVDDVIACIEYSTKLFWRNGRAMDRIRALVERLEPLERAAVLYIGDLYHVAKYNPELMRGLVSKMIEPASRLTVDRAEAEKCKDGDTVALVSLLCAEQIGSRNFDKVKEQDPALYDILIATCYQVHQVMAEYRLFIREILTTRNVPASIAKMPETIRRVSLVSDTDSTMASVQWWAEWYCGKDTRTGKLADAVSDSMIYLAVQNITHMMARMSTNIGMSKKHTFRYAMKNEYKFASFCLTNKAKHYFSLITSREGTLYEDPELEVKGVALRTSNIPPLIMDEFRQTITSLSTEVMQGRNIKLMPILRRVAEIEHSIIESIQSGDFQYLKTGTIKTKTAYTKPESSSYVYHEFWEETFGPKYGSAGNPSYEVVKIAVDLETKSAVKKWLAGMADRELASRIEDYCRRNDKTFIQILLPEAIVSANKIPKEILDIVNYRRIIFSSVEPYYHVLEALGVMMVDDNRTTLVSDFYG